MAAGGRVLVVDDDAEVRRVLVQMLLRGGYEVSEASNGKEALAVVSDEEIGVMVTDLVMPEFEGLETIRACREVRPNLKIVAISGAFGGEFLGLALRLGADITLPKPIRPDVFIKTVQQLIA